MNHGRVEPLRVSHEDLAAIASEVFRQGGSFRFRAHGRSMWPFVRDGDDLLVRPLGNERVKRGDLLLFSGADRRLVAHRVTGVEGDVLHLRGDRLRAPAERAVRQDVVGKVVAVERDGKRLSGGLRRPMALAWIGLRAVLRLGSRVPARMGAVVASTLSLTGRPERQ